jgi:ribosome-associated toxin RatA of RatAB toxin-antitoxin module
MALGLASAYNEAMTSSFSAGLIVAALGPFAAGDGVIGVGRAADGRGCHIQVSAVIEAPIEDVHAVVGELARYCEWFPTVRSSTRTAEGEYEVWFRLPWPLKNVRERLTVADETARDGAVVRWRQLDGDFARNEGSWTLRSLGPNRTAVRYDNVVQFRRWVPAWLIARAERRVAPQMIGAIERRANDRAEVRRALARAGR